MNNNVCQKTPDKKINKGWRCESCYKDDFENYKKCHEGRLTAEKEYWKDYFKKMINNHIAKIQKFAEKNKLNFEKEKHEFLKMYRKHWAEKMSFDTELDNVKNYNGRADTFIARNYNLVPEDLLEVIDAMMRGYHKGFASTVKSRLKHQGKKKLQPLRDDPLKFFNAVEIKKKEEENLYNYRPGTVLYGGVKMIPKKDKKKKKKKYSIKKASNKKKKKKKKKTKKTKKTSLTPIEKMVQETERWYEGMDDEAMMKFQANILDKEDSPLVFVERQVIRPRMLPGEDAIILAEQRRSIDSPQPNPKLSNKFKRRIIFGGGKKTKRRRRRRRRKTKKH